MNLFLMIVCFGVIISCTEYSVKECQFNITQQEETFVFNLSRLNSRPFKEFQFELENLHYVMYFSPCEPLESLPVKFSKGKSNFALIKTVSSWSLPVASGTWSYVSQPTVYNDSIELTFHSLTKCDEFFHKDINYSVKINFKCAEKEKEMFEIFSSENCSFVFSWRTPVACLRKAVSDCTFSYKNHVFDLSPLNHPFYHASNNNNLSLRLNFCGSVYNEECEESEPESVASGCFLFKGGQRNFNIKSFKEANYIENKGRLDFSYTFRDSKNGTFPKLSLKLICDPTAFLIQPHISRNKHTITVSVYTHLVCLPDERCDVYLNNYLYRIPASQNVRIKHENITFLLNPCGESKKDSEWLGGTARAAMINGTVTSLGSFRRLRVLAGKSLSLVLSGGSHCPGSENRASATIDFKCSEHPAGPSFVGKSKDCTFAFTWEDPIVCPVPGAISTSCDILDPIYGEKYEFRDENFARSVIIKGENKTFNISLCGEIGTKCNGSSDSSICLLRNNKEMIIGRRSSQELIFEYGALRFELTGEECSPGIPSKSYIDLICDFGASKDSLPVFLKDSNCVFSFKWKTKKACLSDKSVPCTVKTKAGTVDLTPLRKLTSNYKIFTENGTYYLLNVCGSLWYGRKEVCPKDSGACLLSDGEYKSIGFVGQSPVYENGQIKLVYEDTFLCPSNSLPLRSIITFICSIQDKGPKNLGFYNCSYNFVWESNYACESKVSKDITIAKEKNVAQTVSVLNLSFVTESTGISLSEKPQVAKHINITTAKPKMHSEKEGPNIITVQKETEDKFCSSPLFPDSWIQLPQTTFSSNVNNSFVINVCRKIEAFDGQCSGFICRMSRQHGISSLGSSYGSTEMYNNGSIILRYNGGSRCLESESFNYSSSVILSCKENVGVGVPELWSTDLMCHYKIFWETNLVCHTKQLQYDRNNCALSNSNNSEIMTFKNLFSDKESNQSDIFLRFCLKDSRKSPCDGDVCIKNKKEFWVSGGHLKNFTFSYKMNKTVINFERGDLCTANKRYSTKVYLLCISASKTFPLVREVVSNDNCTFLLELVLPFPCWSPSPSSSYKSQYIAVASVLVIVVAAIVILFIVINRQQIFSYWHRKRHESYEVLYLRPNPKKLSKEA